MPTSHYWLKEINKNRGKFDWFHENEDVLFDDLLVGLGDSHERENFIPVLISTLPFLPTVSAPRLDRWHRLIHSVIDQVEFLQNPRLQCEILNAVGYFNILCGNRQEAAEIYQTAHRFVRDSDLASDRLETMIGYLWLVADLPSSGLKYESLTQVLMSTPEASTEELHMRLYHAIAAACNHWGQYETAQVYGTLVYKYWKQRAEKDAGYKVEEGRAAHLLSTAYRRNKDPQHADVCLEKAAKVLSETGYIWQYSSIMYEYGIKHFFEKDYDAAIASLTIALNEVLRLNDVSRQQATCQSLGIALSMRRDPDLLERGHEYLQKAYELAKNPGDLAEIRHNLAFNCAKKGDYVTARREIEYGLSMCQDVRDQIRRETLIGRYRELSDMIDRDDAELYR